VLGLDETVALVFFKNHLPRIMRRAGFGQQAPPRLRVVGGIRHVHKRFRVAALGVLLEAEVEV